MMRITPSGILLFLLKSWAAAADAQSASPPVAPPVALLHLRDPSFVPIVAAFGCIILFIGFFNIYLWHCSDANFASVGDPTRAFTNCCSCCPSGIDPKLLEKFPILTYSTITHLEPRRSVPSECAVCLTEFNHHDSLRLLPKCSHIFHRECIDTWLASHVTCPVCRVRLNWSEHRRRPGGDNEQVAIVIPNEVNNHAHHEFDESSVSRIDLSLRRCHTTGHSLGFDERNTLRLPDDLSKQIMVNYGWSASAGAGAGRSRERFGNSLTTLPFISDGNVLPSSSSSSPHLITLEVERRSI